MFRSVSVVGAVVLFVVAVITGCATTPPAITEMKTGDVWVESLKLPASVKAGEEYLARFEGVRKGGRGDGILVTGACFTWHTSRWSDGPYCFSAKEEGGSAIATLRTRNPNNYWLSGYLLYNYHEAGKIHPEQRKSNEVTSSTMFVNR